MAVIFGQFNHSNISEKMVIKILGSKETPAYQAAEALVKAKGHLLWCEGFRYTLAIAPLLTEKITDEELKEPVIGTLVFHPSPLPYGRGASSINGHTNAASR